MPTLRYSLLTILLLPGIVLAQEPPQKGERPSKNAKFNLESHKKQWMDRHLKVLEFKAQLQSLEQLQQLPWSPEIPSADVQGSLEQVLKQGKKLQQAQDERSKTLAEIQQDIHAKRLKAVADWSALHKSEQDFYDKKAELEARGVGTTLSGPAGLDSFTALWLLFAWCFLGLGLLLMAFEQRQPWRRYRRGVSFVWGFLLWLLAWIVPVVYLAVAGWFIWSAFPSGMPSFETPEETAQQQRRKTLVDEIGNLDKEQAQLDQQVEKQKKQLNQQWQKRADSLPLSVDFKNKEKDILDKVRATLEDAWLTKQLAEDIAPKAKELRQEQQTWAKLQEKHQQEQSSTWLRLLAVVVALVVGLGPLGLCLWRKHKHWKGRSQPCPTCLNDQLKLSGDAVGELKCSHCGYCFPRHCNSLPRLYFPTYGQVGSGKTFWLVTAYDLLNNNKIPYRKVKFSQIRTQVNAQWDQRKNLYLPPNPKNRRAAPTIPGELPHPLLYTFADADPWSAGEVLVNLFDFSGETTKYQNVARNAPSKRALVMDGFILFLDPNRDFDEQMGLLADFHRGLRQIGQTDPNAPLNVPVAVCLTQLDILVNRLGPVVKTWLQELRDTEGEPLNPALLRRRSRAIQRVLPTIFGGRDVQRTLEDNFGRNFLFFPGTPVGLAEAELGITDLTRRGHYQPFGILEPILWLLYMSGFDVFGKPPQLSDEEAEV